jgi:hypothetical protein
MQRSIVALAVSDNVVAPFDLYDSLASRAVRVI